MQTGANGSPRGVDDRHAGDLRIILCDRTVATIVEWPRARRRCGPAPTVVCTVSPLALHISMISLRQGSRRRWGGLKLKPSSHCHLRSEMDSLLVKDSRSKCT